MNWRVLVQEMGIIVVKSYISKEVLASSTSLDPASDGGSDSTVYCTPVPAPRRSTRVKPTAHLKPDIVCNFNQVEGDGQQTHINEDKLTSNIKTIGTRLTF